MNKKIVLGMALAMLAAGSAFATSFDGLTSVGGNYTYRDGEHLGGLTVHNFGYVNDCPVGYLVSFNSGFNVDNQEINMLVGPSYRYQLQDLPMSIDAALGLSASGQWFDEDFFELGIGGYLGATYRLSNRLSLLAGCTVGYDMLSVSLDDGDTGYSGDFFVSPSLGIGFNY
ncbi:MAG: hypothetical protein SPF89_03155 [Sphaerochaetaceae bacterium]|nr:hypothetical protein [Spirochaetales bacterium]MDY5499083.1 hypothetical protein [Sphaerochaetaceae bacterium]